MRNGKYLSIACFMMEGLAGNSSIWQNKKLHSDQLHTFLDMNTVPSIVVRCIILNDVLQNSKVS